MSPIIDLQRRQVEAGRIRAGDRSNGNPRKLAEWRLTSKDKTRLDAAAERWGGKPREWKDHPGEFELYTTTAELPIMLLPGAAPTTWYELWSKGGCQRRCDGVHEIISDAPCLCGEDRECKPTTRLSVLLPDLPGVGSWLLSSTGWNAAAELAGVAELLGRASAQGVFVQARLRLEQRTQVKGGQTRRFAVPVIDVDVTLRDLIGGIPETRQITTFSEATTTAGNKATVSYTPDSKTLGYTPMSPPDAAHQQTLAEAIEQVEQQEPHRGPRSAPQLPTVNDDIFETTPVPVPVGDEPEDDGKRTGPQTKKLNVLVGTLREKLDKTGSPYMTTDQVWGAVAKMRERDKDEMIEALHGRDFEGVLHWSPLRDSLTRAEASNLIDRLEHYEAHIDEVEGNAAADEADARWGDQ